MPDRVPTAALNRILAQCLRPNAQPMLTFDREVLASVLEEVLNGRCGMPLVGEVAGNKE